MTRISLLISLLMASVWAQAQVAPPCVLASETALHDCTRNASQGLAAIRIDGRWGFVSSTDGRMVIAPRFDAVGPFSQGRAAALEGTRWGYVGRDGQWLVPPRFAEARAFSEDRALAREEAGPWQLIGLDGRTVARLEDGLQPMSDIIPWQTDLMLQGWVLMQQPGMATLVTPQGLRPLSPDIEVLHQPTDGLVLAAPRRAPGAASIMGYLGGDGQWAIAPQFDEARPFLHGFAAVRRGTQWSVIDRKGGLVRQLNAQSVVSHAGHWLLDGPEGQSFVLPDGQVPPAAASRGASGAWPALDEAIRESHDIVVLPPVGSAMPWALLTPKKGVRKPAGWVDAAGKLVFKPEWLSFGELPAQPEWPLVVETLGGRGAVDAKGAWVVPPRFDTLGPFEGGRAELTLGDNHGLAETSGRLLLPPAGTVWTAVDRSGLAIFQRRGQTGVMRVDDSRVVWVGEESHWVGLLSGRAFTVRAEGGQGLVDQDGRWVLPAQCEDMELLARERWLCRFRGRAGRVDFIVDAQGRQTEVSEVAALGDGVHAVFFKGRCGILFASGELVWTDAVVGESAMLDATVAHAAAVRLGPGPGRFHAIDPQGRRVASHQAEEAYRSRGQAQRLVLLDKGMARLVSLDGKSVSWPADVVMIWNDPHLLTLLQFKGRAPGIDGVTRVFHATDDKPRVDLKGIWITASTRWMVPVPMRAVDADDVRPSLKLRDVQTGRDRQTGFQSVFPDGGGYFGVRGKDALWGLADERLQVVVAPAYRFLHRVSEGTLWAAKAEGLDLLTVKGTLVGSLVSRCGQIQWLDAKGKLLWPSSAAACADSHP